MSKRETPLTRRFWRETGGTLIEEFLAVTKRRDCGWRRIDGVIVLGEPMRIAKQSEIAIEGRDIVVVQTKAKSSRLGMPLLGQALFSRYLLEQFKPRTIRTVAICGKGDSVLEPLAKKHDIEIVLYPD